MKVVGFGFFYRSQGIDLLDKAFNRSDVLLRMVKVHMGQGDPAPVKAAEA